MMTCRSEIDIVSFIPEGHKNAVTDDQLSLRTGINKRSVRELIAEARAEHCILNLQDGHGYFIPTEEERDLVERYLAQEYSRHKNHQISLMGAEKWLGEAHNEAQL